MFKRNVSKKIVLLFIALAILSVSVLATSIEILHPNGGELFHQELIEINWTGSHDLNVTAAVRIFYDEDNIKTNGRKVIAQDLPVNGSLNWSVLGVPNGSYYISGDIVTSNFQIATDYSDNSFDRLFFNKSYTGNTYEVQVGNTTAPDLTIVLPNSTTIVRNQYGIKFYLSNDDEFYRATISYMENNVSNYIDSFLFSDSRYCENNGAQINCTYVWDSSALNDYYKLNISITDGLSEEDTISNLFRVSNSPDLNITYPNNGESVDFTNIKFQWTATDSLNFNLSFINIYLAPDKNFLNHNDELVAINVPNNGSYLWNVPVAFPDGNYYVLINASAEGYDSEGNWINVTGHDFSDQKITFDNARNYTYTSNTYEVQVGGNTIPNLEITSPNIGKVFSDFVTVLFNVSDNESNLLTLDLYWSHSISELGTLLESQINHIEICNDSDLDTSTENNCEYTINTSGLNFEDNFIHIFVDDSSSSTNKSTFNFSIDNVPIISNLNSSNETTSSVIINWEINEPANGTVYFTERIPHYPIINTTIDFTFEDSTQGQCPEGWTCLNDSTTADSTNGSGCNIASNIEGSNYAKVGCNETIGTMISDDFFLPEGISKVKFLRAGGADIGGLYVKIGADGSTSSNPGTSCLSILNGDSSKQDGNYWIDPDNSGPSEPFEAYCDMTTDGGGWTLVATASNFDSSTEIWFMSGGAHNNNIWTEEEEFGTSTQLVKSDSKSPAYWTLTGSQLLIQEEVSGFEGKRKYNLSYNKTMKELFQLPANTNIKSSSTRIGTDTTNDYAFCDNDHLTVNYDLTNDGARLASRTKLSECTSGWAARVDGGTGYNCKGDLSRNSVTHYNTDSTITDHTAWFFIREETDSSIICSAENGTDTDAFFTMYCEGLEGLDDTTVHIELIDNENSTWGKTYIDNITFINTTGDEVQTYQKNYTIIPGEFSNSSYVLNHSILLTGIPGNREYQYYVESYDNDLGPNGTTSLVGYFTLFNNPPDVEVLYPNTGEVMTTRYVTILWNASDIDGDDVELVDIYYDDDDNKVNGRTQISLNEINDGTYSWDLFGLPNGQYYISIDASSQDLQNNVSVTVTDYSDLKFSRQDIALGYTSNTYEVQVGKNNPPQVNLINPVFNEIIDTATYSVTFNTFDNDSDPLSAYVYYSNENNPEDRSNLIVEGLDMFDKTACNVIGDIFNTTLVHTCSYPWETNEINDSNYSMIVEVSDSVYSGNDTLNKFILNNGPENFTINITDITQTNAKIIWDTNKNTNSTVIYGVDYTYSESTTNFNYLINHEINLTNLIPNKQYHAYAISCDYLNYCKTSPAIAFKTPVEDPQNESQFNVTVLYPNNGELIYDYSFVNWTAIDLGGNNIKINIYYDNDLIPLNGKTLLASNLDNDGSEYIDFRGLSSGNHYILVEAYKTNIGDNQTVYYRDYSDLPFSKYSATINYSSNTYDVQININNPPVVFIERPEENSTYSTDTPIYFNLSDENGDDLVIVDIGYYGDTYKKVISVSNPSESVRYNHYPMRVFFDTKSLIDTYKLDALGQKLVIMNSTGEVPYYIRPGTFDTTKTEIWFENSLDYGETKNFEFRYGPSNRLHLPYQEPNWSHFDFEDNILINQDVLPVTEDTPDYPATNSNDGNDNTRWRGTNFAIGGITGHANSIEWIKYTLDKDYYISRISYTLTGTGIGETHSTYSTDGTTFYKLVNATYVNAQQSADHYFLPTNMSYFYVDIRSLISNPEFYEVKLQEPVLLEYITSGESRVEGGLLSNEILATQICDDIDFTTKTSNNCSYQFDSANLDGYYHVCVNVTDYLLYTQECSQNFTIQNYEESPILVKDIENQKFVNIFNRKYNLNENFNDPDNQHMTYGPQFYTRELLCHFENESCLDLNNSIVNPNSSQNVSFAPGVFNNASVFNDTELIYPLNDVNTEGSIEMWINATDIITEQTLVEVYENLTNNTLFRIYINDSKINFNVQNVTSSEIISYNISSNEFFHFASTYYLNETSNNISMFINSILVNESNILNYTLVDDYNVVLGNSHSSNKHFEGLIDEFRISNDVPSFVYNLNYSYINEYPPIMFNINQTNGRMTVHSSNSFRGQWDAKFIATDTTNRSAVSNSFKLYVYLPANYSTYSGSTTLFNEIPDIKNVSNAIVENNFGRIEWDNNIDAEGVNFDVIVNISDNFARVDSSGARTLNGTATINLYNLSIARVPDLLVDYNDNGNFVLCPSNVCTLISYNITSGELIFNVTEFTTYIAEDNYNPNLDIPDFEYITNNTPSLIDLWDYTTDNEQDESNFTYTIINQSNSSLSNCVIFNTHYIDCSNPGENVTGSSLIWVSVNDTELTDNDSFTITFDYDLTRYTFLKGRNNLESEVNLIMKVQYYNGSSLWEDVALIYYNHTYLNANEIIDLSDKWNSNKWNTSFAVAPSGTYRAYVAALDNENNTIVNSDGSLLEDGYNFTVHDTIIPIVHLIEPADAITSKFQVINFTCNITDDWVSSITLELWNASNVSILTNTTSLSGLSNSTTWNISVPYEGIWTWNCLGKDMNGNSAWSDEGNYTFEFVLDNIPPSVQLMIPKEEQTVNGTNIGFLFNSSDNNATSLNCSVNVDGTYNQTVIGIGVLGFIEPMTEGIHNWSVNCTDAYDNSNWTSTNIFAVGCGLNKTLCQDGTCSEDCDVTDGGNQSCINPNGICEFGEGCACNDCINQTTMCNLNTICNENGEFCIPLPSCGNDLLEQGEICDTNNFAGKSCSSYGFDNGRLECTNLCLVNTSKCYDNNEGNTDDNNTECTRNSECNDNNPCTMDTCALEKCYNTNLNCGTEEFCSNGFCIPIFISECESDSECDDGNDCTSNYCSDGICKSDNIDDCEEEEEEEEKFAETSNGKNVACLNDTQVMDLEYEVVKNIIIEEGRSLVVNPLALTCIKGHEELSLMIPDKYKDETVFLCHEGKCEEVAYEKVSSLTCQDNVISKYRRDYGTYMPDITTLEMNSAINELVIEIGNVNVKLLNSAINEPTNEFVKIIENPVVVEVGDVEAFNITMRYKDSSSIDEGSLGIFVYNNGEWKYFESFVDYDNNTVTAEISNYDKYLEDGKMILSIVGSICDNCIDSRLENVYSTDSKSALVMVHGFGGNAGSFQPLINDFSLTEENIDLWTFSYPSTKNLDNISNDFNELMNIDMVKYDNIVIVGHSLGGLVVQNALNKSENDYVNKVDSIVLLGSPNKGISLIDKFIGLIDYSINIQGSNNLFNINSEALKDIKKERNYPRIENVDYYVVAGTEPYKFEFGGLKFYSDQLLGIGTENDGLVTVDSARNIGGEENLKLCENYWEVEVTHSDLEEIETSRKLIKNIIFRNLETDGLGDVSYFDVSIEHCSSGDVVYATAALDEDYDNSDPIGCNVERKAKEASFLERFFKVIMWGLAIVSLMVVLIIVGFVIYEVPHHKKNVIRKSVVKSEKNLGDRLKSLGQNVDQIENKIKKIK